MAVIEKIRERIPRATFTTDLMVGFPGEGEAEFLESVDFARRARFLDAHIFAYSRREGTEAAEFADQVPESIKRERSERLIAVKNAVRDELLVEIVKSGEPLSCIVETLTDGYYTAHADNYVEVRFAACEKNLSGELVELTPISHENGILYCRL